MTRFEPTRPHGVTPGGHRRSHVALAGLVCLLAAGSACDERPLSGSPARGGSGGGARAMGGSGPGVSRGTGGRAGEGDAAGSPAGGKAGGTTATGGRPAGSGGATGGSGTGGTGGTSGSGGARPTTTIDVDSLASACIPGTINPGRSPLRRLSRYEYDNSVRDLVSLAASPSTGAPFSMTFPPEISSGGVSNDADEQSIFDQLVMAYMIAVEEIALAVVSKLDVLALVCDPSTSGAMACAMSFIGVFGKKAFRRSLAPDELARYQDLFADGSADGTYEAGITSVIAAMLQSPYFLYRVELGRPEAKGPAVPLTSYELATKLAYFLWGSLPDAALFAAADTDQLTTPAALQVQVQRMVGDPRARDAALQFHREWLGLDDVLLVSKDMPSFPDWSPQVAADLMTESETFADRIFWDDGNLKTLFSAPFSYLNGNLAKFYGVSSPADPATFVRVGLDRTQRAGILTQGAFLANLASQRQTSPSQRGIFVQQRLLCRQVPPEPPSLPVVISDPPPGTSTRQRLEMVTASQPCSPCHRLFDPIGFGFENFDAVGRWRTTDGDFPVDASGEIVSAIDPSTNGPFNGPVELMQKLATSADVRACVVSKWFRWSSGRAETLPDDACSLLTINKQFQNAKYDMRAILPAIVTTDAFRYRSGGPTP